MVQIVVHYVYTGNVDPVMTVLLLLLDEIDANNVRVLRRDVVNQPNNRHIIGWRIWFRRLGDAESVKLLLEGFLQRMRVNGEINTFFITY